MTYSASSTPVAAFVAAYQENRNLAAARGPSGYRIVAEDRRKYVAIDEIPTFEGGDCAGRGGRFLIDRETGTVYTIRGYGQRGHRIGTLERLTGEYRAGSATYNPAARSHVETGWSRCASWGTPRPALRVLKGGRS